ncbi:MAG TPA: glycosyltransferase [Vicinamibacterales bacterium]|nr:glycosyltransferase [Vicinamibacterales bacterium]
MRPITLVYAFYDNKNMLLRHLREWLSYAPEAKVAIKIIVVDDASPSCNAADIVREFGYTGMDIQVYRVKKDTPWNQDGARNLAMTQCATEWAFMTDMDHLLPRSQAKLILEFVEDSAEAGWYYMPNQYLVHGGSLNRPHPNTYLMRRDDFWRMGGYDEDFAGWYGSDGNFRKCAKGAGLMEIPIMHFHTVVFRAGDIQDANTKLSRKEGPMYAPLNHKLERKRRGPPYRAVNPVRFEWKREL